MLSAECPECGETVELDEKTQVGDRVVCPECGVELELLSLYPLELDYTLEEDWEGDWDEDDGDGGLDDDREWDDE